jgi:serine/threonine-protein kinase
MGVVGRGRHISHDEGVALKVLGEDVAVTTELFTRFMREAKAAAKLKSKHVARVNDVGRLEDGSPYMVMELLEGRDLAQVIKDGALGPAFAAKVVIQTCEVLAEAHAWVSCIAIKLSTCSSTDGDGDRS